MESSEERRVCFFDKLPVELLYRIVDYLDTQTILLSFRYVCRKFRAIGENYKRFEIDFRLISSKDDFDRLCRFLNPETLLSLSLVNSEETPGEIDLFFSRFGIEQFLRLRSLTLINVPWKDLKEILQNSLTESLTSLSLHVKGKCNRTLLEDLSKFLHHSPLEKLVLNTFPHSIDQLFVSISTKLRSLSIGICTFDEYQTILRYSPQLRTLILDDCWISDEKSSHSQSVHVLSLLTLKNTNRSLHQLEELLSLTPYLTSLQIFNSSCTSSSLIDGSKWQSFLQQNLIALIHFEFIFYNQSLRTCHSKSEIEPYLQSFRTEFWLKEKRWFVHCDYIKHLHQIRFYSVPYPLSTFEYHLDLDRENLSLSTWFESDSPTMVFDRIQSLNINFNQIKKQLVESKNVVFRNVTELHIRLNECWSIRSIDFLSTLIHLSSIRRLFIHLHYDQYSIFHLFARLPRLKSLHLIPLDADALTHIRMEKIASSIPSQIKHVTVKIQNLEDMKIFFNNLPHISSISFNYPYHRKINSKEIIQWLQRSERSFSFSETDHSLSFWLNKL